MTLRLSMDHQVPVTITDGLRRGQIDVLTALDDAYHEAADEQILNRATELGRILFTRDIDFLTIGRRAQVSGYEFTGIVYGHQMRVTTGEAIRDLTLICEALTEEELRNQILFLPL